MRHFEFKHRSLEVLNQGFMVGCVARRVDVCFYRRDECVKALADLRLFGLQTVEFSTEFCQGLVKLLVRHRHDHTSTKRLVACHGSLGSMRSVRVGGTVL